MSPAKQAIAGVLALVFALGLAWLSQIPTSYAGPEDAMLRLSWRVQGTMIEECRTRTPEELEALAPHMRTPRVCTGRGADYELSVEVDERAVARDTLRAAGARRDRPVYVFREIDLEPGSYEVTVDFRALVPPGFAGSSQPLAYGFDGAVSLGPAQIALLTVDSSGRALVLREP